MPTGSMRCCGKSVGSRDACPAATCRTAARHCAQVAEQSPMRRTSALIRGLCGRASTCPSKELAQSRTRKDGFGSVRNEEIAGNSLDVVGAELQIHDDVQTCGVVRIHKKNTLPLYMIICPVNMTSPAGAAEQLAGGFDSGPGVPSGLA